MQAIKFSLHLPLLLLALFLAGCNKPVPVEPPKLGDTISDVTFTSLEGNPLSLTSIEDKLVVIHFWATWCAPAARRCRA